MRGTFSMYDFRVCTLMLFQFQLYAQRIREFGRESDRSHYFCPEVLWLFGSSASFPRNDGSHRGKAVLNHLSCGYIHPRQEETRVQSRKATSSSIRLSTYPKPKQRFRKRLSGLTSESRTSFVPPKEKPIPAML